VERRWLGGTPPTHLNCWQEAFCEWNAERLGLSLAESRERFDRSWAALAGGHGGRVFKMHAHAQMELCRPFWGNTPEELRQAYAAHQPLQLLRLLSYREPSLDAWPELRGLEQRPSPRIVDFGCGLAQLSITWTRHLRERGRPAELFLADLPLLQLEFLRWLCPRWGLPATIAVCTPEEPIPPLPPCDLCVATEVLEHVHDPMRYLESFAAAVKPGGCLLTNIEDHTTEFLHVSPQLASLREYLVRQGWRALRPGRLYEKPGGDVSPDRTPFTPSPSL